MSVLDDVKTLLNISDTSKDAVLIIYISDAIAAIKKYLNLTDATEIANIDISYSEAVRKYVIEAVNRTGVEGLKSYTQGSRQGQLETGLSDMVKALLPYPYVTMYNTRWYDHA